MNQSEIKKKLWIYFILFMLFFVIIFSALEAGAWESMHLLITKADSLEYDGKGFILLCNVPFLIFTYIHMFTKFIFTETDFFIKSKKTKRKYANRIDIYLGAFTLLGLICAIISIFASYFILAYLEINYTSCYDAVNAPYSSLYVRGSATCD